MLLLLGTALYKHMIITYRLPLRLGLLKSHDNTDHNKIGPLKSHDNIVQIKIGAEYYHMIIEIPLRLKPNPIT